MDITVSRSALFSEANFSRLEHILFCVTRVFHHLSFHLLTVLVLKKKGDMTHMIKQAHIYSEACSETNHWTMLLVLSSWFNRSICWHSGRQYSLSWKGSDWYFLRYLNRKVVNISSKHAVKYNIISLLHWASFAAFLIFIWWINLLMFIYAVIWPLWVFPQVIFPPG